MASRVMPRAATGARGRSSRPNGWSLSPGQRKLALAAHIVVSVGLLGISAAMLVLGTVAAATPDSGTSRAAYLAMGIFTRGVIQPAAVGALVTGLILSLGTKWGLLEHYWIVAKLALTGRPSCAASWSSANPWSKPSPRPPEPRRSPPRTRAARRWC